MAKRRFLTAKCTCADLVQVRAVLERLTKPVSRTDIAKARNSIVHQTRILNARWRATVATWVAGGVTSNPLFLAAGDKLSRFTFCSPAFVTYSGTRRYCMRSWLCPWCYAREVKETWEAIDKLVFPPASTAPRVHSAFDPIARHFDAPVQPITPIVTSALDLVIRTSTLRFPRTSLIDGVDANMLRACLSRKCVATSTGLSVRTREWRTLRRLGATGGIEVVVAFPDYPAGANRAVGWVVTTTQLILVAKSEGATLARKITADKTTTVTAATLTSRMDLVDAVANALRYPVALLAAPPAIVEFVAAARSGLRLTARFGTLRNRKET